LPYKERPIEKKYYSIGEVAEHFSVATSLIRYWEKEFENINPKKNSKGNRKYTQSDIKEVEIVYHLVKEKGYTLSGAKELIYKKRSETVDKKEIISSLKKVKEFLLDLKEEL